MPSACALPLSLPHASLSLCEESLLALGCPGTRSAGYYFKSNSLHLCPPAPSTVASSLLVNSKTQHEMVTSFVLQKPVTPLCSSTERPPEEWWCMLCHHKEPRDFERNGESWERKTEKIKKGNKWRRSKRTRKKKKSKRRKWGHEVAGLLLN